MADIKELRSVKLQLEQEIAIARAERKEEINKRRGK
jgi:hypothetical protein